MELVKGYCFSQNYRFFFSILSSQGWLICFHSGMFSLKIVSYALRNFTVWKLAHRVSHQAADNKYPRWKFTDDYVLSEKPSVHNFRPKV